eukprot:JP446229.1.p1 GENE.JP446229.1~~JP446229.1.p1  ORF type:complete len:291 (+),score=24.40 JP446229.1:459-1331(+)
MNTYLVREVIVFNRQDCCTSRLNGAKVYLLNQQQSSATGSRQLSSAYRNSLTYAPHVVAQYVRIERHVAYLSLAEVEVYGQHNVAYFGRATSSSVAYGGVAARAVDGNTSGSYGSGSVTHTTREPLNWWKVDLLDIYTVNKVRIYNRVDCCGSRLDGAELRLSFFQQKQASRAISSIGSFADFDFDGVYADHVNIRTSNEYLSLAEIQVYGVPETFNSKEVQLMAYPLTADENTAVESEFAKELQALRSCDAICKQRLFWKWRFSVQLRTHVLNDGRGDRRMDHVEDYLA